MYIQRGVLIEEYQASEGAHEGRLGSDSDFGPFSLSGTNISELYSYVHLGRTRSHNDKGHALGIGRTKLAALGGCYKSI